MMVIKGGSQIQSGDGSYEKPYTFGDSKSGSGGSLLKERSTGEYLELSGILFRIIDV